MMMKQRYPIFCSVFKDAYDEDLTNFKTSDLDFQNSNFEEKQIQQENDTTYNDYENYYEIDVYDDNSYQPKQEEELDFAHDLEKVSSLIEQMVISLPQPPEEG